MTITHEYTYLFRDLDTPNRFYHVTASDSELATLRAFGKFGKRITSWEAQKLYDLSVMAGQEVEVIEWTKELKEDSTKIESNR